MKMMKKEVENKIEKNQKIIHLQSRDKQKKKQQNQQFV